MEIFETKRQKFVRLAQNRMNNCLKQIELLSNLSNKSTYEYTQSDVNKIVRTLKSAVNDLNKSFGNSASTKKFSL